jgi:nitrogen fixation NifU-like protein
MLSSTTRAVSRVIATRSSPLARSVAATQTRSYHDNIVEHYENPQNVGSLDKNDDTVGTVSIWILFAVELRL